MSFVKLDENILRSSVWMRPDDSRVFITLLLLCRPTTFQDTIPTLEIGEITPADFLLPPGDYGLVEAAGPGIAKEACMDYETVVKPAMRRLASPDPESKSHDFEGRRIARIDGGFVVLNYDKYRAKTHIRSSTQRVRDMRDKKKGSSVEARAILDFLNEKTGKNFQAVAANLEPIRMRLGEYGAQVLRGVITDRVARWGADDKMQEYLRPSTLFRQSNCANYVGELPK